MKHTLEERNAYFDQEHLDVEGARVKEPYKLYQLADTKQIVAEYEMDLGLQGETVEIGMIADIHINAFTPEDDGDEELKYTREMRLWGRNACHLKPALNCMEACSYLDQTVLAGDTMDFLSHGTKEIMIKEFFERDPGLIACVGSHEYAKNVGTGHQDKTHYTVLRDQIKEFWIHDIAYYSKLLKDKVLVVNLENSWAGHFVEGQREKLLKDVELARKNGWSILIFMHEPISCEDDKYLNVETMWDGYDVTLVRDFTTTEATNSYLSGTKGHSNETDREVYDAIVSNGDVIKAVFNGHYHNLYYTEIKATYTDEKGVHDTVIPQITMTGLPYNKDDGVFMRIKIK